MFNLYNIIALTGETLRLINSHMIRMILWSSLPCFPFAIHLQKSDKGQIFYWSSQASSRISRFFGWLVGCHHAQETSKLPYFRLFLTWHLNTFCPYCLTLALYGLLLTKYHEVPTSTGLYWPSLILYWPTTTKYQPAPPHTDPVPQSFNQYRPILIAKKYMVVEIMIWSCCCSKSYLNS